jgi:hypothetical protein
LKQQKGRKSDEEAHRCNTKVPSDMALFHISP